MINQHTNRHSMDKVQRCDIT